MLYDFMYLLPIALPTVTINEPSNAGTNPLTEKPCKNEAANINKAAFITKIKRPKVRIEIGKVRTTKIGLTMALRIPKTTAATIAM